MKTIRFSRGSKLWFTSDTHYHHRNIAKYCKRPWLSAEEQENMRLGIDFRVSDETLKRHDDAIITNINDCVGEDDVLIHCGDVVWGGKNVLREFRDRLKCKNVIVLFGNHDDDDDIACFFECYERIIVQVGEQKAVCEHYPGDSWNGSHKGWYLLFGHVHGVGHIRRMQNPSYQLSQDVGVDLHGFKPWNWERELVPLFEKLRNSWEDWRKGLRMKEKGGMAPDKF